MSEAAPQTWYLYVLRCNDRRGSLYTGITTDVDRRLHDHNHTKKGAKYTSTRRPVKLMAFWPCGESRGEAMKAERAFKRLSRRKKLARVASFKGR